MSSLTGAESTVATDVSLVMTGVLGQLERVVNHVSLSATVIVCN